MFLVTSVQITVFKCEVLTCFNSNIFFAAKFVILNGIFLGDHCVNRLPYYLDQCLYIILNIIHLEVKNSCSLISYICSCVNICF